MLKPNRSINPWTTHISTILPYKHVHYCPLAVAFCLQFVVLRVLILPPLRGMVQNQLDARIICVATVHLACLAGYWADTWMELDSYSP